MLQARNRQRRSRNGKKEANPGAARPAARRGVTGEQATVREWVEERDKAMAAEFRAHRAETTLDIANLAAAFGKEMRDEIRAAREEAKRARDDDRAARYADRAMARNGHLWTWGLIAAVGLGLAALIDGG